MRDLTTEAISKCHIFLRECFGYDPSVVSLREIARFKTCVEFFQDYFLKKNNQSKHSIDKETEKVYKIKSIICSIYLCYYIRLTNEGRRGNFEYQLKDILLEIANFYAEKKNKNFINDYNFNLYTKIRYEKLSQELRDKNFWNFSDLLKTEEEFLVSQIIDPDKDKGIGINQLLKENLFLLFLAIVTKIPLIIVGKPGTGKSLSAQLIYNSMRGKYSKKSFFTKYPKINQIYFQGTGFTTPDDVDKLFRKTEGLYKYYLRNSISNDTAPIYMILFNKLELAEIAPTNPLNTLHSRLEYDGKTEGTCFIGISEYFLDATKMNKALCLSVPNLEDKLDQLKETSKSIVQSISDDIDNDHLIFNILSRAYERYKYYLNFIKKLVVLKRYAKRRDLKGKDFRQIEYEKEFKKLLKRDKTIKTEFHGNRDFYNIIKGVAIEGSRLGDISDEKLIVPIINNFIERNFGGITYGIDINFNLEFEYIKEQMKELKEEILN